MTVFTYVELFAGIGGVSFGFDSVGGKCVMAAEFDPQAKGRQFAQDAYKILHPHVTDVRGDVFTIDEKSVPDHDILSFTTPCQSFSVAGKKGGFEDTRGTLVFEALRIAKEKRPKALFMENVKGMVGHDGSNTIATVIHAMNEVGYIVDFNVLSSKFFGVPQARERVFIVGIRSDLISCEEWKIEGKNVLMNAKSMIQNQGALTFNFEWCEQTDVNTTIKDILEPTVADKYYYDEALNADIAEVTTPKDITSPNMVGRLLLKGPDKIKRVYDVNCIATTLTAMSGGHHEPKIAYTVGNRVVTRKLTPRECFRMQSFPEKEIDKLYEAGFKDGRLYKFAGNAVTVNVITAIAERIIPYLNGK